MVFWDLIKEGKFPLDMELSRLFLLALTIIMSILHTRLTSLLLPSDGYTRNMTIMAIFGGFLPFTASKREKR